MYIIEGPVIVEQSLLPTSFAPQNYFRLDFRVALWSINYMQNPEGIHKAPSIINN